MNSVFIAQSLDGYIADMQGGLEWLNEIPNPDNVDMGYYKFMDQIDAIVMGRKTFETVCSFDIDWPYNKPVFVISNTLNVIPEKNKKECKLVNGSISEILTQIHTEGFNNLYIDGGITIQNFLKEDRIDEIIITTMPVLLGGGTSLFAEFSRRLEFKHIDTKVFLNEIVQSHYRRKK